MESISELMASTPSTNTMEEEKGWWNDPSLLLMDGCEVTNLVFFPFGMGAFLRNLYKLDPEYAEDGVYVTKGESFRHRERW